MLKENRKLILVTSAIMSFLLELISCNKDDLLWMKRTPEENR